MDGDGEVVEIMLGNKREQKRKTKITKEKRVRQQTENELRSSVIHPERRLSST